MRILHLISCSGVFGAERVVLVLSKALKKRNFHPVIGVISNISNSHFSVAEEAKAAGLDTVIFPCIHKFDLKLIFAIRNYIEKQRIDLIHCHGYKSNLFGLLSSHQKIPKVTTNHNWLKSHWKLRAYCLLDSLWIRFFDRIVSVSQEIKDEMLKFRIPEEKISVVDNGIDLDRFDKALSTQNIRREFKLDNNIKIVGTIGALGSEKGHDYFLQTAKDVIQTNIPVKFFIVGDGPLKEQLEYQIHHLGIGDNVILTGYRKDIPEILSLFDIFVLPSVKEGLPMVLLEALAAKKAVIATNIGAIPKVIIHNETGLLVEPLSSNGLSRELTILLNNPAKAEQLGQTGYLRVKDYFSSDIMTDRYISLYAGLVQGVDM